MLQHLFKLMWNKKRAHGLLIVEILASFLVLFGVSSLIIYNLRNHQQPIGFDYQNVWIVDLRPSDMPDSLQIEVRRQLKERALSYPQVEAASFSTSVTPMSMSRSNSNLSYKKASTMVDFATFDEDFARTLRMQVAEGRLFNKADEADQLQPVIINRALQEKLFGDEPALGKFLGEGKERRRIVGIMEYFKQRGEYQENTPVMIQLAKGEEKKWVNNLMIRVKPGTDATFEAQMMRDFGNIAKGWSMDVTYMEKQRENQHNLVIVPVIIFLVVSGFLLINVALGLFGILNLNIAKRREEIGLRRALGATASGVSRQFVGEIWVLATFGLLIGLIFAGQFPLMNVFDLEAGVYLLAMLVSVLVIYGIVTLCALYPSRQAATIQPAMALHEE
ncbi:ABC transporter permease [Tellurirhabdus rosea]|uniref:ABC transporter permease n=1 Tax=Tellurirhabdus rosea TaxID=2674997 RepID=UPI002253B4D6|nr:ABC transporter permease [Tellurirhabdus rosea]